jgi:hypothetical protein
VIIYIAGAYDTNPLAAVTQYKACYWKITSDSQEKIIPESENFTSVLFDIYATDDIVYCCGLNFSSGVMKVCYWKNEKFNLLPSNVDDKGRLIFVLDDDVYIAGIDNDTACYWKNDELIYLEPINADMPSEAVGIFVKYKK